MITKPKTVTKGMEEDDSYLKPGMKDENESAHKIGTMPVKKAPVSKTAALKKAMKKFGKGMK